MITDKFIRRVGFQFAMGVGMFFLMADGALFILCNVITYLMEVL